MKYLEPSYTGWSIGPQTSKWIRSRGLVALSHVPLKGSRHFFAWTHTSQKLTLSGLQLIPDIVVLILIIVSLSCWLKWPNLRCHRSFEIVALILADGISSFTFISYYSPPLICDVVMTFAFLNRATDPENVTSTPALASFLTYMRLSRITVPVENHPCEVSR